MTTDIVIIIILATTLASIFYHLSRKEGMGFPFDKLYSEQKYHVDAGYQQPYCSNCQGQPKPCKRPCQEWDPACKYSFPVPVFSDRIGAYSPNKWCPGPPVC